VEPCSDSAWSARSASAARTNSETVEFSASAARRTRSSRSGSSLTLRMDRVYHKARFVIRTLWPGLSAAGDKPGTSGSPAPGSALLTVQIAAMLARFTGAHLACLARLLGGGPDLVVTVPSTRVSPAWPRAGRHPLETAVAAVTRLAPLHVPLLRPGPAATGH